MKRGFTKWAVLALLAVLFILAAILYPVFQRAREIRRGEGIYGCSSRLKNIGFGIGQYIQDYDDKYPIVISGGTVYGWAGAIQPYVKSTLIYQCPSEVNPIQSNMNPRARNYTDYWMNSRIAGQSEKTFTDTGRTFMLGDGNDGTDATDARYALDAIPNSWRHNASSPLQRHMEGANYAFADGHAKWIKANNIEAMNPSASPKTAAFTFAVK